MKSIALFKMEIPPHNNFFTKFFRLKLFGFHTFFILTFQTLCDFTPFQLCFNMFIHSLKCHLNEVKTHTFQNVVTLPSLFKMKRVLLINLLSNYLTLSTP